MNDCKKRPYITKPRIIIVKAAMIEPPDLLVKVM